MRRAAAVGLTLCFGLPGRAVAAAPQQGGSVVNMPSLTAEPAGRFAKLALACVRKEYPNKIAHVLEGDGDVQPPRQLTPSFYGCYDWHSAVHGHWLLAHLARTFPAAPFAAEARAALAENLTAEKVAGEVHYFERPARTSFERPYGVAWLLQLAAELRAWDDPQAKAWSAALAPLERAAASRLKEWLPKLLHPVRIGEHEQTAFSLGLIWDWSVATGDTQMTELLRGRVRDFYSKDRACPLAYEPGGQDFLSPCLAEADLMRRTLAPAAYATWLTGFMPQIPRDGSTGWLPPAKVSDRADPKLGHLDGLNLSRAWMLHGIASALAPTDPRVRSLRATAGIHRDEALPWVTGDRYEGGHWLGTFAVYLLSSESREAAGGK